MAKKPTSKPKKRAPGNAKYADWITPEGLTMIQGWTRNGLMESQIAKNIGIRPETLSVWKKRFPQLNQAIKKSRDLADIEVENALYKSALGHRERETTKYVREYQDGNGNPQARTVESKEVERYYPPNPTSIAIWLNNRKPDDWRKMTSAQEKEATARLEKMMLENEKLKRENELLKAQTDRLTQGGSSRLDMILQELILNPTNDDDDDEELEQETETVSNEPIID